MTPQPIRLAVLQRVCPAYRIALFSALSRVDGVEVRLFIGDDVPGTLAWSAPQPGRCSGNEAADAVRGGSAGASFRCMSVWWMPCGDSQRT